MCLEGGGGKIKLLKAGAYKDNKVDISLITHPAISPDTALLTSAAFNAFKVEYFGKVFATIKRPGLSRMLTSALFRKHMLLQDLGMV